MKELCFRCSKTLPLPSFEIQILYYFQWIHFIHLLIQLPVITNLVFLYFEAENWKFWRFNNRLPNATNSKSFSLNVSSLPDCYDEFVNSRTYRSRWGGFGFNHNTKKCTLYSHLSTSELKVDAGSELYVDSNDGSGRLHKSTFGIIILKSEHCSLIINPITTCPILFLLNILSKIYN